MNDNSNETTQIENRRAKLKKIQQNNNNAYPNNFRRSHLAQQIKTQYNKGEVVKIAGRIMTRRIMGKASFFNLQDISGNIQVYVKSNALIKNNDYQKFINLDLGDIIAIIGYSFTTKKGEVSVYAQEFTLLTKSLRPLPDKFHGLMNVENKQRQRYLDLIANSDTKDRFKKRSKIVSNIRSFLEQEDFLEVETPMMHSIAGGALAKPFVTHHNTLDLDLYLRIAPELYLKRLIVGGFERVFEMNRNFRNEGLSSRHNPEFTMVEFYMAYTDYKDMMQLLEKLIVQVAQKVNGHTILEYKKQKFDLSQPFECLTMQQAIKKYNKNIENNDLMSLDKLQQLAKELQIKVLDNYGIGKLQLEIFEKTVEENLLAPTFITNFPAEVSPLARRNDFNPFYSDRFELYIDAKEIANGFSELNDVTEQTKIFKQQVQAQQQGDEEAMSYDKDYITALEYGLAPTSGAGIGVDRLVMLFTACNNIRDVILFPQLRKNE